MKAFGTARLGSDMEVRFMPDGTAVGQVSIAVRLGIKDKQSGDYRTQWINASLFGKRAESLAPMLKKGSLHAFHLRDIHIDEFAGKDGQMRTSLKATIEDVELCWKQSSEHSNDASEHHPGARSQRHESHKQSGSVDTFEDVPFMWHGARGAGIDWRSM